MSRTGRSGWPFVGVAVAVFLAAVAVGTGGASAEGSRRGAQLRVALVALGPVDGRAMEIVRTSIAETFDAEIVPLPPASLPKSAWYAPRKRYRAGKLLDWLRPRVPDGADRILGVTTSDISIPKPPHADWGICGYGDIDGPAAVVSTYRVKRKLGVRGKRAKRERYERRLAGLAAHELGHTLGLRHCAHRGCTMEDAKGSVKTFDHWNGRLCDDCRAHLTARGVGGGEDALRRTGESAKVSCQRQPLPSPSGRHVLTVPISRQDTVPEYRGTPVWKVTIRSGDTVVYEDTGSTFVGTLNAYWAWDADDRVWLYATDTGEVFFWEQTPLGWKKYRWGQGDTRTLDRDLTPPQTLAAVWRR